MEEGVGCRRFERTRELPLCSVYICLIQPSTIRFCPPEREIVIYDSNNNTGTWSLDTVRTARYGSIWGQEIYTLYLSTSKFGKSAPCCFQNPVPTQWLASRIRDGHLGKWLEKKPVKGSMPDLASKVARDRKARRGVQLL